jgi:[protein-PII] uridylyltransferase
LLGRFSKSHPNLEVGTIDIFKLYDEIKYFKIEFSKKVDEFELEYIEEIITNSFDMTKKIKLKKPIIKQGELEFNCNHSKTYATMNTNIQNQKGLIAYIVQIFDNFKIDIASTKIQTIKGRAINLFLIEKNGNFCANKEKIWDMLLEDKG